MRVLALFIICAGVIGCLDAEIGTQDMSSCDGTASDAIDVPFGSSDGVGGFGGEGGGSVGAGGIGGEGGGNPLRADGASCDENAQCANDYCIPSKNSFGIGVCFSQAMVGCIVVTDPSPFKPSCDGPLKRLFVCGDWDTSTLGTCSDVGIGDVGETYLCCDKT